MSLPSPLFCEVNSLAVFINITFTPSPQTRYSRFHVSLFRLMKLSMTTLYGIKNCDTIKKAKQWLENHNIDYQFHDYRAQGLESTWLSLAETKLGWENLLNKRGTTFRQLSDQQKADLTKDAALALMLEYPAMIKRPVLIHNNQYYLGFKADQYNEIFA